MVKYVTDFAEIRKFYTGANNKRKWVIVSAEILLRYLQDCDFKPARLAKELNVSYATVKRFLCEAGMWDKVKISSNKSGGRKRTTSIDKFGYAYADASHDVKNARGEVIRRYEHHVNAEKKYERSLADSEVVHHIDLDKSNNAPENLVICQDNREHRNYHCQLEIVAAEFIKKGFIRFEEGRGYYDATNQS